MINGCGGGMMVKAYINKIVGAYDLSARKRSIGIRFYNLP